MYLTYIREWKCIFEPVFFAAHSTACNVTYFRAYFNVLSSSSSSSPSGYASLSWYKLVENCQCRGGKSVAKQLVKKHSGNFFIGKTAVLCHFSKHFTGWLFFAVKLLTIMSAKRSQYTRCVAVRRGDGDDDDCDDKVFFSCFLSRS